MKDRKTGEEVRRHNRKGDWGETGSVIVKFQPGLLY